MFTRAVAAVALAAVLSLHAPMAARANPDQNHSERRDGQSRYELAPYNYLPIILAHQIQRRIAVMLIMTQSWSYQLLMATGVNATNQNRVDLGGLFGGLLAESYSAEDFVKSLEVGTVYQAGEDTVAVALKDDLRLDDYRVIVFNGDNQYDIQDRPALRQVDRRRLAQLSMNVVVQAMLNHTLSVEEMQLVAGFGTAADNGTLAAPMLRDLLALREFAIGRVYLGGDNTLLVVIPPAIVLEK